MEPTNTLREKLRARRKVINDTIQITNPTPDESTELTTFVEPEDDIPTIGDTHVTEEDENALRDALESRRERTRRKLNASELQQTPVTPQSKSYSALRKQNSLSFSDNVQDEMGTPRSITSIQADEKESAFGTRSSSMHTSLKSKFQAKLQAAKQQREGEEEAKQRTRRLRDRMNLSTRFDSMLLGRPDTETERDLQKRVLAKLEWKRAIDKMKVQMGQPSAAECDDFFMKQYEPEPEEEPTPPAAEPAQPQPLQEGQPVPTETAKTQGEAVTTDQPADTVIEVDEPTDDDKKKLIDEIVPKELDWKLFNITAAEYMSYREQLAIESVRYFVPSLRPALLESKMLDPNIPPRYLEEEGIYVGKMPDVQQRNINILENRILKDPNGKGWFGEDGRVICMPDPVKDVVTKPWVEGIDDIDPAIETVYVKAYDTSVDSKYLQGSNDHELQVDLGTVFFLHHPLMSREHVLASSMGELYDAYIKHKQMNYSTFYRDKLKALRGAVASIKGNIASLDNMGNPTTLAAMENRLLEYVSEVRRATRQRDLTESHERDLIRRIVSEWEEIKAVRQLQGYLNTSVKLTIKQQEVNQEEDRRLWNEEISREVKEYEEEYKYTVVQPYRKTLLEYRDKLQSWKRTQKKMKEIEKISRGSKENLLDNETDEGETTDGGDISSKPIRPTKPAKFNTEQAHVEVNQAALNNRRNPGEPKISLEVTNTASVTPNTQVPSGELNRRKSVQRTNMFLKVWFNGREVCRTDSKPLSSDFKINFGRLFQIRIAQWPESLNVQLYEAGLVNTLISEVFLNIPDGSVTSENTQMIPVEFKNERVVIHDHEGVGSSTPFTIRQNSGSAVSLQTRGQLICSIAWGLNDEGEVLAPRLLRVPRYDPLYVGDRRMQGQMGSEQYGVPISQDPEAILRWTQQERLDPNDPSNAGAAPISQGNEGYVSGFDVFRLEHLQNEFNFVSDKEFEMSKRHRILQLRDQEIAEFRNLRMIPCNENEILDSAFTAYERRIQQKDALGELGEKKVTAGTLSAHRLEVMRFRQRIREAVLHRFFTARHQHSLQDMINEDQVPDIGTLGINLLKIIEPRRPLKPVRKTRKKVTAQNLSEGSVNILVSVARAYNLPVRDQPIQHRPLAGGTISSVLITRQQDRSSVPYDLCPFVSIAFQGNVLTTNVAQGPNPSWNEELEVPFAAPNNDYSVESLQSIDDTLFIHLFDRVIKETSHDSRDVREVGESSGATTGVVAHRVQNYWLGCLKIPFTTLYQRGKIEGTFRVNIPPVLLGYSTERLTSSSDDPYIQMESQFLQPTEGSYLSVFITLEPELTKPEPVRQKFETQEDEQLIRSGLQFLSECNKKFPDRKVKTTVIDIKGESVFITRYISPLAPPPELLEGSTQESLITAQRLARFVSLIPFVSDNVVYAGICDLWSTCDQFVNMLCGDEEEHALLLLNFFLYLGKEAYLVLGNAIPEGDTAYVLTHEPTVSEYFLWNASNGQNYKVTDNLCPLQCVGSLISKTNIYFNMQTHDAPSRLSFRINNQANWKPLFTASKPAPDLPSVQPPSLAYVPTDLRYVHTLEMQLNNSLKDAMMKWRPRHVTRWNRACSNVLKEILKSLEEKTWRSKASPDNHSMQNIRGTHSEQLSRILGEAEFIGFPMSMTFVDIPSVIQEMKSTEVYKIQEQDVEFSLAVHIHPYPASVLCVWLYVAAINNTRRINF